VLRAAVVLPKPALRPWEAVVVPEALMGEVVAIPEAHPSAPAAVA
jgi:hypothetical protein